jgi:hypothetical protein
VAHGTASATATATAAAQGREALAPSNMMSVVSAVAMYKLAARTTLNGTLQFTNQRQDEQLIPWTINSVIDQPATFNNFPGLAGAATVSRRC